MSQGTRVQLLCPCVVSQCCATVFGLGMYYNYTPGVSVGIVLGVCMNVRIKVETWVQCTARSAHGRCVSIMRTFNALSQVQIN